MTLRLATRGSPLALWQAHHIQHLLSPVVACELVLIETHGDRDQATALSAMGGFGVFTKAIQQALLDGRADVAVHSLKDLPTLVTDGVELSAVPERGPTGDAFVSERYGAFEELPQGATVGTSSLRRRAMLKHRRSDLNLVDLRGNVETRLRKLHDRQLDGIVLAEAGLVRLGLGGHIREVLPDAWLAPAVGQGAIGLEARSDDDRTRRLLEGIIHAETWARVTAERAMLSALGGGCLVPIGAITCIAGETLHLQGFVLSLDGTRRIVASHSGPILTPLAVGQECAAKLTDEGAAEMLLR